MTLGCWGSVPSSCLAFAASMRPAVPRLLMFDRNKVRSRFERLLSASEMAHEYVEIYQKLCQRHDEVPIEEALADIQTGR